MPCGPIPFGDLKRQTSALKGELAAALQRVLDSGWFVLGREGAAFERAFAEYLGLGFAVGSASGTDAIKLALVGLGVGPGQEVITAANTCVPTLAAIRDTGARPVVVDVDPETYTLDPEAARAAITSATRAIVPIHLYGQCADMKSIMALAQEYGLLVMEDCAQAHGARFEGRLAGTFGQAAAFSFYPTKNLGALGDGGLVVTDDSDLAERLRALRFYGQKERYLSREHGFNSRLDEIQAAVLSAKLPHLDRWNQRRRELAALYESILDPTLVRPPKVGAGRDHIFHLYVVQVFGRAGLMARLAEAGIKTQIHYPIPLHRQPAYAAELGPLELPVSEALAGRVLSLPMFPELTDQEAACVAETINRLARG